MEEFNAQLKQEKDQLSAEHQELLDSSKQVGKKKWLLSFPIQCTSNIQICTVWMCDLSMFWVIKMNTWGYWCNKLLWSHWIYIQSHLKVDVNNQA